MIKTALTIAGSDSSGGAGIQADLKTMTVHGVYGMSVITALTAQNTTGVYAVHRVTEEFLKQQIDSIFTDIVPDAVKIGMTVSGAFIRVIAQRLAYYQAKNLVLDPVMVSTSGTRLLDSDGQVDLANYLFPMAKLITPNLPEAEVLVGRTLKTREKKAAAAVEIGRQYGCSVLLKGGHKSSVEDEQKDEHKSGIVSDQKGGYKLSAVEDRKREDEIGCSDDFLYEWEQNKEIWISGERYCVSNTHGTGCTLSSAIVSNLAKGYNLEKSVRLAKEYINQTLQNEIDLGQGNGPLNHMWGIEQQWEEKRK